MATNANLAMAEICWRSVLIGQAGLADITDILSPVWGLQGKEKSMSVVGIYTLYITRAFMENRQA